MGTEFWPYEAHQAEIAYRQERIAADFARSRRRASRAPAPAVVRRLPVGRGALLRRLRLRAPVGC